LATECTDCCDGGPCTGNEANTPTLDVQECVVRINDRVVKNDVTVLKAFERGQTLDITAEFVSAQDAEDVQVMAFITGYHRGSKFTDLIVDITSTFDMEANVSYEKDLTLTLPDDFKISSGDELKIRLEISDKFSHSYIREYNLKVEAPEHNVVIQDVLLDPSEVVMAGRGLFVSVRVKNMGDNDEESLKIVASIPALGLKATEYVDELESDEATTSEDMFIRVPPCTKEGDYTVKAIVEYADGDEEVTKQLTLRIDEDPECEDTSSKGTTSDEKTVVTVPGKQDVITGTAGTVYPIILENKGSSDRSYELKVTGVDSWGQTKFDPGTYIVVRAGETETAYLYVTPNDDAQPGEKIFMVTVDTKGDKKQIALTANVVEGEKKTGTGSGNDITGNVVGAADWTSVKKGLEIGLVVLVVLLVILGLIVGFNKMKGNEGEKEEIGGQTYY
ncbi:MAG: hypothetical protein HGA85_02030, partial [Nanoarchaeota archaeon]|nr:hypothetical protein [Nanoarchaeota archaeon]